MDMATNLGNAEVSLKRIAEFADSIESIGPAEVKQALEVGAQKAEPMAQKFAVANLNKSGIVKRTGELLKIVSQSELIMVFGSGSQRTRLMFSAKRGLKKEDYIKLNSLEYGAIRSAEGNKAKSVTVAGAGSQQHRKLGVKRRQKLKTYLQSKSGAGTGSVRVAKGLSVSAGSITKNKHGTVQAETSRGGVSATKAFEYFRLSRQQTTQIIAKVEGSAIAFLETLIYRKAR